MTDPDATEEELRVGRDPVPGRLRRPGSVVVVAVLGLAVAWVTTRLGEERDPSAAGSASVSATATGAPPSTLPSPGLTFIPVPVGSSIVVLPPATAPPPEPTCPAGARCVSTDALPAAVTRALRTAYPEARVVSSRTLTRTVAGTTSLVGRSIRAVAGSRRLAIVVGPYVMGPDDLGRMNSGRLTTTTIASSTPGQTVHLVLTEPRTARPDDLLILRLARDPRLAAQ